MKMIVKSILLKNMKMNLIILNFLKKIKGKMLLMLFKKYKNNDFEDFDKFFEGKKGKMGLEDLIGEIMEMDIGDKKKKKK